MKTIKVMTWNVLYKEKADNILSLIKEIRPDILCCQEITTKSQFNPNRDVASEISKVVGNYRYSEALESLEECPASMGNAIFSKFPIKSHRSVYIRKGSKDLTIFKGSNRVYLEVTIDIKSQLLTMGTTHLSFIPGFIETPARNREADKLTSEVSGHSNRFVLTGDLNSAPDSKTIKKIEDKFISAGPSYQEKTFSTKPFSIAGFEVWGLDWRLDYIFTTKDIKVLSSKIINTEFSDHLPIVAEIQI